MFVPWESHVVRYGLRTILTPHCRRICWQHSRVKAKVERLAGASENANEVSGRYGGMAVESGLSRAPGHGRPRNSGEWARRDLPFGCQLLGTEHQDAPGKTKFSRAARSLCPEIHGQAGSPSASGDP